MIVIIFIAIGAIYGALLAKKRGGSQLDMGQYGVVYAIVLGIVGLFFTLALDRFI